MSALKLLTIIDPEFQLLIPELQKDERQLIEGSIKMFGALGIVVAPSRTEAS